MTIKKFISKPTTPTIYGLAISKELNAEKTKKQKDVPLYTLLETNNSKD